MVATLVGVRARGSHAGVVAAGSPAGAGWARGIWGGKRWMRLNHAVSTTDSNSHCYGVRSALSSCSSCGSVRNFGVGTRRVIQDFAHDEKTGSTLLREYGPKRLRIFSIIAHIDHGKSTLSDALLERSGNISRGARQECPQTLDRLQVERERGITVKAQSAAMVNGVDSENLLMLVDCPGHADFIHETLRSLAVCQGALLLVDATQGVQAQTFAAWEAARAAGVLVVPVVTKVDLPHANAEDAALGVATTFDLDPEDVIATSAKAGLGIEEVLSAIVDRIPPPPSVTGAELLPLRARLVDSWFDPARGVVCLIQVVEGCIQEGDRVTTSRIATSGDTGFSVQEVGLLAPAPVRTRWLGPGHVGYVVGGRNIVQVGDTFVRAAVPFPAPLPPMLVPKSEPILFASVYPVDGQDVDSLIKAVQRLALNDGSLTFEPERSQALGSGLRMGFLGMLHLEVFQQRLREEFGKSCLMTAPGVVYQFDNGSGKLTPIQGPSHWPSPGALSQPRARILEPMVDLKIFAPSSVIGPLMELLLERRGMSLESRYASDDRVIMHYRMPWQEVVTGLDSEIKALSHGYASFTTAPAAPEASPLILCEIAINSIAVDALSFVAHRDKAQRRGKELVERLKNVIRRQQFEVVIQARIGVKPFARARIPPFRKDVLVTKAGKNVGGGDVSRKRKLLEKQKAGKARSKTVGSVELSQEAFWSVLGRGSSSP